MKIKTNRQQKRERKIALDPDNEETINLIRIKKSQKKRRFIQIAVAGGILAIGAVFAFVMYPNIKPGPDNIRAAEKAMKENDYDVAVKELSRVIWVREDDSSLYKKRAEAYLKRATSSSGFKQKKDFKNAVDDANMAMRLNPDGNEEDIKQLDKLLQDTASETGASYLYNASLTMGNTVMNLENDGLIVCDLDGTTYVANSPEVGNIKRVDVDGKETVIYKGDKEEILGLNLRNDNLIFKCYFRDEDDGQIVSIDTTGENSKTLFKDHNVEGDLDEGKSILYDRPIVLSNRMYLYRSVDNTGNLFSASLNGENMKKVSERSNIYPLKPFFGKDKLYDETVLIADNRMFLLKRDEEESTIWSLDSDGKEERCLIKIKGSAAATVQGDNIYVCSGPDSKRYLRFQTYDLKWNRKDEVKFQTGLPLDDEDTYYGFELESICVNNDRLYYAITTYGNYSTFGNAKLDGTDNRVATEVDDE